MSHVCHMHVHWPAYNIYVHILKLIMEHNLKLELSGAHTPCASAASGLYPDLNLELENVDDLYLHITLHYCAHEQKAHGLQLIGVVNKNTVFVTLVDLADLFKA